MISVPLEELQHRQDEVAEKIRNGEQVLITDQGRDIAELTPVSAASKALVGLRRAGKIEWSGGKPQGLRDIEVAGKPVSETVLESRR